MIEVVGIGLDGAAGLTENVRQLVENATLLIGSDRHLNYFPNHSAQRIILGDFLEAIEETRRRSTSEERIVILVSGDPLFFGLGRLLLEKLPPETLSFHPHLSSVQLAFNRIKIPWQDARIVSVHGRSLDELTQLLKQGVEKIAILTDGKNTPSAIARLYLSLQLPIYYDFWVCENLEAKQEQIYHFPAGDTNTFLSLLEQTFAPLNVVILLHRSQLEKQHLDVSTLPLLGLTDQTFLCFSDHPGLMTKREIRLVILGELALQPGQIVWDIGAGTGSVSIEIARLCPTSVIYAVEKTAMGITLIEQNCQRMHVSNLISVYGTAPQILTQLPEPNRIFIGGSGGNLLEILEVCQAKLTQGGILVLALATLEHLHESITWMSERRWYYRLLQLQISRSTSVGELTRFTPLNPVTLITAQQK